MNNIAQFAIMSAELANNYKQTDVMERQLQQDYDNVILQMDRQGTELARELNKNIVNVMSTIGERLGDISEKLEEIGDDIRIGFK